MVVAVCALLIGSGRSDFSETEIKRELDLLAGELRRRYGFTEEQKLEGLRRWVPIRKAIRHSTLSSSTYGLWIRPLRPAGFAGGRLWLTGPGGMVAWTQRRYKSLIEEAAEVLAGEKVTVGFMGLEDGS